MTVIVAAVIYFLQKQKKKLAYRILSRTSLLSVQEEIKKDIEILYKKKPVNEVQLVIFKFLCLGNISIKSDDYETPITINLGEEAQILSAQIIDKKPHDLQTSIKLEDNRVVLQQCLLNQDDTITIRILATEIDPEIKVEGRIAGVKKIEEISEDSKAALALYVIGFIAAVIGLVLGGLKSGLGIQIDFLDTILMLIGVTLLMVGMFIERRIKNRFKKELETLASKSHVSSKANNSHE